MPHWERLRQEIDARGLGALVAEDGQQVARNLASELQDGLSVDNYDPLMAAHWALVGNCMEVIERAIGPAGLREVLFGPDLCPLCYLNQFANNVRDENGRCTCGCNNPEPFPENPYDNWIERAATDQVQTWKNFSS